MTRYILAGGNDRAIPTLPQTLKNVLPTNVSSLKILSCLFSVPMNQWQDKADDWRHWFSANLGIDSYDWANYDNFVSKISAADIVYFHGGDTSLLLS